MRAFLEKQEKEWLDDFVYMSNQPLLNLGWEIISFDGTNLKSFFESYNFDIKTDILIGSVEATNLFFTACGLKTPTYLGYPDLLNSFLGRTITKSIFKDVVSKYPYFIKPADSVKLFTGCVIENEKQFKTFKTFYPVKDDTEVYVSEILDFISEYRCFIYEGEIKGIQWYKGDVTIFPSSDTIKEMVKSYKNALVAYTLDVGIVNEETKLVEINDFWAIGSYGFNGDIYVKMAIDRMRQIGGLPTRKQINERIHY